MSSEWPVLALEDCLDALIDYRGKTPTKTDSGVPLVTAKVIKAGRIETPTEFIAEQDFDSWMRRGMPEPGDVVMTTEAPLGEVAQLGRQKVALAQRVITLRGKAGFLDNDYLLYLMMSEEMQDQLKARATGTTVLGIKQSELRKISLKIPPLEIQKAAASMLKALDDRIALLRETNTTLEAIAQALFKSWFVDFDPVHANAGNQAPSLPAEIQALFPSRLVESPQGLIPEGWAYVNLGELVCNQSTTFKFNGIENVVFINTGDVSEGIFLHQNYVPVSGLPGQAKKAIKRDDILFSEIRPKNKRFAYVNIDPQDYVVSTKFMVLRAISEISPRYIYQIIKQDSTIDFFNMIAESRSGTFPQITFDSIQNLQVLKPSKACVNQFIHVITPIIEQIDLNAERNKELASMRDSLLPRLISGQLRLPEAQAALAEVLA